MEVSGSVSHDSLKPLRNFVYIFVNWYVVHQFSGTFLVQIGQTQVANSILEMYRGLCDIVLDSSLIANCKCISYFSSLAVVSALLQKV